MPCGPQSCSFLNRPVVRNHGVNYDFSGAIFYACANALMPIHAFVSSSMMLPYMVNAFASYRRQ